MKYQQERMKLLKEYLNHVLKNLIYMYQNGKDGKGHYHQKIIELHGNKLNVLIQYKEQLVVHILLNNQKKIWKISMIMKRIVQQQHHQYLLLNHLLIQYQKFQKVI